MGKHQLTAVSLFAGVGGFDLALERAGVKVVAAVEIDKNARGVLAKQFPNTKLFNDVTTVTGEDLRDAGFIPEHGIITGGFPCQDLSVAGKRAGLAGARSGLFYEIARIADETKAKWLVLENVPGLLSSQRGADMGAVIGTLVDLGYGVAWRVLDAQHFGVPQRRRRVFIVAQRAGDPTGPAEVLFKRTSVRGDTSTSGTPRQEVAGDVGSSSEKPMLLTQREGKPGGGKGPLISVDQSLTLATQNSQVLYDPVGTITANGFRCDLNKAQSGHPTIGFSHTQGLDAQPSTNVFPTLRVGGGGHAVMEPEPVIVGPLTASGMANAKGTETTDSHHYVLEPIVNRRVAFGVYLEDDGTVSTQTASQHKDSTDLVIEPTLYEPMSAFEENWAESEVKNALRAGASKSSHALVEPTLYEPHHGDGRATEGIANTLAARMGTGGNNTPVLVEPQTFVKVIRSGARDADGNLPPEVWREEETNPTLNQFDQGDSRTVVAIVEPIAVQGSVVGRSDAAGPGGKGHGEEGDPMFTLNTTDRHAVAYPIQDGREIEKSQNGIGVGDGGDPAYTIDTTGAQSVATGTVRRLTPTECERLQGFPDGWTAERIDEAKGLVTQADSSRYKQMGNAVAVPCVEWIVNGLVAYEQVH